MCGGKILLYPMHETGHVGSVMATMDSIRSPPPTVMSHMHTLLSLLSLYTTSVQPGLWRVGFQMSASKVRFPCERRRHRFDVLAVR